MKIAALALAAIMLCGAAVMAGHARAAEIKVLCSNGLREVMLEVAPEFEGATGHKLDLTFGLASAFKQRIEAGEPFDVVVLVPALLDDVLKQGKVTAAPSSPAPATASRSAPARRARTSRRRNPSSPRSSTPNRSPTRRRARAGSISSD